MPALGRTLWPLLAAVVAAVGLGACVMPPPLEEIPTPTNQPPRILPQNLDPAPVFAPPVVVPAACPDYRVFEASLNEPDGDTLYWRVFIDYFANKQREPDVTEETPEAGEDVPISFTIENPDDLGDTALHTVELYVADRPFAQGQLVNQGRRLQDAAGLVDTFVWTVELDEALDGRCP